MSLSDFLCLHVILTGSPREALEDIILERKVLGFPLVELHHPSLSGRTANFEFRIFSLNSLRRLRGICASSYQVHPSGLRPSFDRELEEARAILAFRNAIERYA